MRLPALLLVALLACASHAQAAECGTIVGWVGVPLCQDAGAPPVAVPDVLLSDEATGTAAIEGEGLFVADPTLSQCSDEMAGTIVDQDPDGGTLVALGSFVTLWLASGNACGEGIPPLWLRFENLIRRLE